MDTLDTMKPSKIDVCRAILLQGSVFIHLDPSKHHGLLIPARLRLQPQVVLQWGFRMPVPIPDMVVDERGISGTLSFKGIPFHCNIPWASVFAVVGEDARGMVWPEDLPEQVKADIMRESAKKPAQVFQFDSSTPRKRNSARVSARPGADRSFLRVVK